jgi:OmpA-OmpF porin, OOP family
MRRAGWTFVHAAALLGVAAAAQSAFALDLSGAYIGGNFGRARSSYDTGFIDNHIATLAGAAGDTVSFSGRSIQRMSDAWWASAGYFFNPYVGIDAGFFHIGEIKYVAVGSLVEPGLTQALGTSTEVSSHGPALSLIGRLPLTENFSLDLRVGDYYGKTVFTNTISVDANGSTSTQSKSKSTLLAGVGASYTMAGHWSVRIDYLRVNKAGDDDVGKYDVNLATAGVSYTF